MSLNNFNSDYGSGSSMNSSTSWSSQDVKWQTSQSHLLAAEKIRPKASSFADLVTGRVTLEDVMQEFRMNGSDSPYNPEEEHTIDAQPRGPLSYMRQKSWPAPDRTPAPRLPRTARPLSLNIPSTFVTDMNITNSAVPEPTQPSLADLTHEQRRVLSSLSDKAVLTLLREIQRRNKRTQEECRFCKNNGERESYYRSHTLRDACGRVSCPVLRAFRCGRCGAGGDSAHTIKYCPLSTCEERIKSAAMLRSVRMASGRRRVASLLPSSGVPENYVFFGETPTSVMQDTNALHGFGERAPLDPLWAALEQKLSL